MTCLCNGDTIYSVQLRNRECAVNMIIVSSVVICILMWGMCFVCTVKRYGPPNTTINDYFWLSVPLNCSCQIFILNQRKYELQEEEIYIFYPYNKNQQDSLFTFNLRQQSTSTCCEQAYCASSGGITLYVQQLVYVMRLRWLDVGRIRSCQQQVRSRRINRPPRSEKPSTRTH